METITEDFFIDPEFINTTNEFLLNLEPFVGLSPAGSETNFLGVKVSSEFFRLYDTKGYEYAKEDHIVKTSVIGIEAGEKYFELGSLYASIKEASGKFNMIELGGGWGDRSVIANAIIKKVNPVDEFYVLVEAMKEHCLWIKDHMKNNGINPEIHSIINAIIWTDNRPLLFPNCKGVIGQNVAYGVPEVVANFTDSESKDALINVVTKGHLGIEETFNAKFGSYSRDWSLVSSVTLRDILLPMESVDYIDMDIQGAERTVIKEGIDILETKVKRIHIGTHGMDTHQVLLDLFKKRDWHISVQIPPMGEFSTQWGNFQTNDGIISVINKKKG